MTEYMLLIRNESDHQADWAPDRHRRFVEACQRYIEGLTKAGKLIAAQPLVREGRMIAKPAGDWAEGPFSPTKEVIVGYYHIRADDLGDAIAVAKGNPEFEFSTTARIEIRPIKTKETQTAFVYPRQDHAASTGCRIKPTS
jgi:hypothetical protein